MRVSGLMLVLCLPVVGFGGCASAPSAPPMMTPEAFAPLLRAAFASDNRVEWETAANVLLARTDLTDTERADVYFERRIKRGVFVESGTVATPQCAVEDIDRALALVPNGVRADAARRDRVYQVSRYPYFTAPGNCD